MCMIVSQTQQLLNEAVLIFCYQHPCVFEVHVWQAGWLVAGCNAAAGLEFMNFNIIYENSITKTTVNDKSVCRFFKLSFFLTKQ